MKKNVEVSVQVTFRGRVTLQIPASVPKSRRELLAEMYALSRVLATLNNPGAPDDEACEEYASLAEIESEAAEAEWDKLRGGEVGGLWHAPRSKVNRARGQK